MSMAALYSDCKAVISQIRCLTNEELDAILSEDGKIEALLSNLDQSYLKDIASEKETLLASNASLSEFNLNREPEFMEGREKVVQLSVEGEQLTNRVKEKYEEIKSKTNSTDLDTMLALLRTAASEMEEQSDCVAKKYLDKESELDDFLEQFLSARKVMHLRLIKAEKMSKLMTRDPTLQNYANAPGYFPPNPMGSVPYPTGPLNMPMPGNYYQNHY